MDPHRPTKLSIFYHRIPHLNTSLHRINSTFDTSSHHYLTSLNIIGSVPPLILICLLLLLLIYLLTRCCDRRKGRPSSRSSSSACCVKFILATFGLICCCTIALGLYGNDDLHNSITTITKSISNINKFLQNIQAETRVAELMLRGEIPTNVRALANEFEKEILNRTVYTEMQVNLHYLRSNISLIEGQVNELSSVFNARIDNSNYTKIIEMIRWNSTLVLLILFIIFNIVLFYAICKYSRCSFITFSVLGLFALITNWTLVSIYLVSAVATGDFCISPIRSLTTELIVNRRSTVSSAAAAAISPNSPPHFPKELTNYYINCADATSNPLSEQIAKIDQLIEFTRSITRQLKKDGMEKYDTTVLTPLFMALFDAYSTLDNITNKIMVSSTCTLPYNEILLATESLCGVGLMGITFLLLSALGTAIVFTILVGFDSHAWIYIQKKKSVPTAGDESISFLQGSHHSQHSQQQHRRGTGSSYYSHKTPLPLPLSIRGRELSGQEEIIGFGNHINGTKFNTLSHTAGPLGYPQSGGPQSGSFNGKYATLNKQCKTLEANDFY